MQVINLLAEAPPEGIGFNDICDALDLNRMTCSRILQSARDLGYLAQTVKGKKWILGPRFRAFACVLDSIDQYTANSIPLDTGECRKIRAA